MINNSNQKYVKMTKKIIYQIQNSKRKDITKYQTFCFRQSKEIKLWCEQNNINCNIVEDLIFKRNKLKSIDIWYNEKEILYDDRTRDYGHQYLDFRKIKQNVVLCPSQ